MMFLLILLAVLLIVLFGFTLFFYRDPERFPPLGDVVLCPADGLIEKVLDEEGWIKIAIFMSPLNVHVQWVPYPGKVISIEKLEGPAFPGFLSQASKNKQIITTLDTKVGKIILKQIVGIFVRRIETFVKVGDKVEIGQRFGRIVFGSRVELWMPKGRIKVKIKRGQKDLAGVTIAAEVES